MARHKLNHRRKKKVERHKALKRLAKRAAEEWLDTAPLPWYTEDGGLLSVNWSKYDCEYWQKHDWSAVGQNALRWQEFFESLPPPAHYEESRKRRMKTMHEKEKDTVLQGV